MSRRFGREKRSAAPVAPEDRDRFRCAVCRFPGVSTDIQPVDQMGVTVSVVRTGGDYTFDAADQPVTELTGQAFAQPNPATNCPFCGAGRVFDGRRGSAMAVKG